ncbi:MAG: hypothetical protein N2C12_13860, partial [Planctomycetales bacterium]
MEQGPVVFEFKCPNGHILEGDKDDAGLEVECPDCSTAFVIPAPDNDDRAGDEFNLGSRGESQFDFIDNSNRDQVIPDFSQEQREFNPLDDNEPRIVTIPCPTGHLLQVDYESMGEEVECPDCGEAFELRYTDSVECQQENEFKQAAIEHKEGQKWLVWAVVAAVGVLILLIALA